MANSFLIPLHLSKQEYAYTKLKEMIISNELVSGALLVERNLSELMHVSRTPIRMALTQLAKEGFVNYYPGRGMAVTEIGVHDVVETYSLREVLDVLAVRLFMENASSINKLELKETVCIMEQALEKRDMKSVIESDRQFHRIYRLHSGSKRLEYMLGTLMDQVDRLMALVKGDHERMALSLKEHNEIANAIMANEVDSAEKAMRNHISGLKAYHISRILEYVSNQTV